MISLKFIISFLIIYALFSVFCVVAFLNLLLI